MRSETTEGTWRGRHTLGPREPGGLACGHIADLMGRAGPPDSQPFSLYPATREGPSFQQAPRNSGLELPGKPGLELV